MDIVVPQLGESITEATVAAWLVKPGESVKADQPVVELETDKATLEIGAPRAGVLEEILVGEGEDVEVGAILGRVVEGEAAEAPDEAVDEDEEDEPEQEPEDRAQPAAEEERAQEPLEAGTQERPAAGPTPDEDRGRRPQRGADAELGIDPAAIRGSGPEGRITREDLQSALGVSPDQLGPAARKWIADNDLDPGRISGSGPRGRITKADVIDFLDRRAREQADARRPATQETPAEEAPARAPTDPTRSADRREERVKMSRMRRTIASRLKEAQDTAAILTTFNEADMGAVMELRRKHKQAFEERHGVRLGFMSFFAKAAAMALQRIPAVNAEIQGEEIVYRNYVDIGMAVSTENGLVVPVVRDCHSRSFAEIERDLADLAERAREGSLSLEEMQGGTFSITNGGVFGSLMSTPILNRPQSAILGLHKIQDRPMAQDGAVVVRPMMYLALSYDHRLVDGREAVTFLVAVKEAIEDPERLLLDL